MPILGDFTIIQDGTVTIGDNGPTFTRTFSTGGRHNSQAVLMLNVRGLTDGNAIVKFGNNFSKAIQKTSNDNSSTWFSQHMVVPGNFLSPNANQNQLTIQRVAEADNVSGSFDDFFVRDIVIFFHQST